MAIRSFVALSIPQSMANALGDCAARMAYQDKSNAVRWVDQANYHLTLAFLGDQSEQDLESLADQLDQHVQNSEFEMCVQHLSPFPESRPKLIAAMIKRDPALLELHQQVISSIISANLKVEKRRFIPHITLGRFRHSRNHFAGGIPGTVDACGEVTELSIFESTLTPSGAEYDALYRFPFAQYEFDEV
ncbi:MAG: RNA 2',3'-cyclic phosphodiesterase [Gammaproteobacteria bacterium]|nr:RNA 2',3'-cyclic phosphodiesterase [Gammaproteobacteria bacterium]